MGGRNPGPGLEVCQAGMAEGLFSIKGVNGAAEKSRDDAPWGLEKLGKKNAVWWDTVCQKEEWARH